MLRAGDQNRDGRLDLADMGSVTVTCLQSLFVHIGSCWVTRNWMAFPQQTFSNKFNLLFKLTNTRELYVFEVRLFIDTLKHLFINTVKVKYQPISLRFRLVL